MPSSKIRELEFLTYLEKLAHWDRDDIDPWKPADGGRYRFANPDLGDSRVTMHEGNIRKMRELVGRPCFGIMTAYLRYRDATRHVKGRGQQPDSRCNKCKARSQCDNAVMRRIRSCSALEKAFTAWMIADGPRDVTRPGWRGRRCGTAWRNLVNAALEHDFKSSNDEVVAAHYEEQDKRALEKDRLRKLRDRDKARQRGEVDEQYMDDLKRAQKRRAATLVAAIKAARDAKTRPMLAKLPNASVRELLDVWLGREVLRAKKVRITGGAIARWIDETGHSNRSANARALSTRVAKDLQRIAAFEKMNWGDSILLPPFNPKTELST